MSDEINETTPGNEFEEEVSQHIPSDVTIKEEQVIPAEVEPPKEPMVQNTMEDNGDGIDDEVVGTYQLPELSLIETSISPNINIVSSPIKYDPQYTPLKPTEVALEIPSITTNRAAADRMREIDEKFVDVDEQSVPDENMRSSILMHNARRLYHRDDIFDPLLTDEETDFHQGVMGDEGRRYGIASPKVKIPARGTELRGSAAISHFTRSAGVGTALTNTLWSCGISVNLRPLTGTEHGALDNKLAMVKRDRGWATSGLTYSAGNSVLLVELLKELKNIIVGSNFHTDDPSALYDIIDITDAQALIGLAGATIFPNGVQFERSCSNVMACGHIASGRIFPDRARIEDNRKLTPEQRKRGAFSATGKRKFTLEEVNQYKESHAYRGTADKLSLVGSNGVTSTFHLKVPSINEFIEDTDDWIRNMIDSTVASLDESVEDGERDKFLSRAATNSQSNQYISWVDYIETEDGAIIRDPKDISDILEFIQADKLLLTGFVKGVRKFIRKATITVVCIPAYTCKACKTKNHDSKEEEVHPSTIALDAVELFFQLGTLRKMLSLQNIAQI